MSMTIREEQYLAKIAGEDVATPKPLTREEELLDKIAKNGGGESELPKVTASDNGKVLAVVEGEWNKADAPSGGSSNLITIVAVQNGGGFDISIDGHEELETVEQINDFLVENFDAPMELLQPAPEGTMSPDIRISISNKQLSPADIAPKPTFGCLGDTVFQGMLVSYSMYTTYTSGSPGTYSFNIATAMYQLQPYTI